MIQPVGLGPCSVACDNLTQSTRMSTFASPSYRGNLQQSHGVVMVLQLMVLKPGLQMASMVIIRDGGSCVICQRKLREWEAGDTLQTVMKVSLAEASHIQIIVMLEGITQLIVKSQKGIESVSNVWHLNNVLFLATLFTFLKNLRDVQFSFIEIINPHIFKWQRKK